jgi:hypothetical protein
MESFIGIQKKEILLIESEEKRNHALMTDLLASHLEISSLYITTARPNLSLSALTIY